MDEIINQDQPVIKPILEVVPKKKLPIWIWIIPLLFIILIYIIFKQQLLNTNKKEISNNIVPTAGPTAINNNQETPDAKQTLLNLQQSLKVTASTQKSQTDWVLENKENIPLDGQSFGIGSFNNTSSLVGKWGNYGITTINGINYINLDEITEDSFKPLKLTIDTFFNTNNFQKDNSNSYIDNTDARMGKTIKMGYIKGNLKCLITFQPQTDPFCHLFCGIIDQKQTEWRKELFSAINPNNSKDVTFVVDNMVDNFAIVGYENAAHLWKKENGQWKVLSSTQDAFECKAVIGEKVSPILANNCCYFDEKGKSTSCWKYNEESKNWEKRVD